MKIKKKNIIKKNKDLEKEINKLLKIKDKIKSKNSSFLTLKGLDNIDSTFFMNSTL